MNLRYSVNDISNETTESFSQADSAISLLGKTLLPKAAELARAGKYLDAECLLEHLIHEGNELPEIFDLMARIRAQQGRLLEAQSYWADAIQLSNTKEFYRSALKRIEHLQTGPPWMGKIRPVLVSLTMFLTLSIIIGAALPLLAKIKKPNYNHVITENKTAPVKTPPQVTIMIPGTRVNLKADHIELTFDNGLFSLKTDLKPEAKVMLDLLAEQLHPYKGKIQVNVEGHTDDLPILTGWIFQDNVSLGMQRAVTVIDYLRLKGQLPAKMFKASSVGELHSPYPNDTPDNQMRNRTVVIRIANQ
ncbi:MAG: OmpA family protein [Firmicutes bacterium]|nr:OmpA family protein [Bacillota bacterium]